VNHEERRCFRVDSFDGGGAPELLGLVVAERFHDLAFEPSIPKREPVGPEAAGEVVRCIGVLEAGLILRVVCGQPHERRKVPPRGSTGDGDEVGIDTPLVGVLTNPYESRL
jgi:hypothetical protein